MKRNWFKLDNAALIFPAIIGRKWSNAFRLSVTLKDPVDPDVLSQAAADLKPRFPTFFVRLRTGFFWFYLEETDNACNVQEEFAYPLTHMSRKDLKKSCLRILYYKNRIAAELFHSITDGTGGLLFIQNLVARYIELKYGITGEKNGVLVDLRGEPLPEEVEDCFPKNSAERALSRREETVYRLKGTPEDDCFRNLITGIVPTETLLKAAHDHKSTITAFLAAVLAESVIGMQEETVPKRKQKPVKITVPVNLRKLYNEKTLRNMVLTVNVGVDPRFGKYSFDELCSQMSCQIASEAVPQKMAGRIAANVLPQKNKMLCAMPLPVKIVAMRGVYASIGERKGCLNISNLGAVFMPSWASEYIERFEFIIGIQRSYPNNCSVISYGGRTYINMIRSIKETELERRFFSRLVDLGVPVEIEYNERG